MSEDLLVCKRLLDTATHELFQKNAFRITGLPIDATPRKISKHGDRLKMMEELGQGGAVHAAAFALTSPPSVDDIRDAIQKLRDPEQRIVDELFWFWPEEFGRSATDPSLCALESGDSETALKIWLSKESHPTDGVAAMHNLAVYWHLSALEWENYSQWDELSTTQRSVIEQYWRNSAKRWGVLAEDDLFWERITARVRQLDDARLTTGFVRRMRATLPDAFTKINAQIAVRNAERQLLDSARFHVQFMRETSCDPSRLERESERALAPATARMREQIQRAEERAKRDPEDAVTAANELLAQGQRSLVLFDLFFHEREHAKKTIFDDTANTVVTCAIAHQRKTGDNETFVALLEQALALALSPEIRQRIKNNIGIGQSNLTNKLLEPFDDLLRDIEESEAEPNLKLTRIRQEIMPHLANLIGTEGVASEIVSQLSDRMAMTLRSVAIDAHNDHDDVETALSAITSACKLATGAELKKRLDEDKAQITRNKSDQEDCNLVLNIRNDQIVVTREAFQYNATMLPAADIDGVQFGVFVQYTNGVKSSVSYHVAVKSASHGTVQIECKRWFRGEDKAETDFNAIVTALYSLTIPALVKRLSKSIASGAEIPLDDCWVTAAGLRVSTGMLFWKEDHLIPWSELRCGTHQGYLNIGSTRNAKVSKTFGLRDVWNAVIFEALRKAILDHLNEQ